MHGFAGGHCPHLFRSFHCRKRGFEIKIKFQSSESVPTHLFLTKGNIFILL